MRLKRTSLFSQVVLSEANGVNVVPKEVQILRVGKFKHPNYGNFEVTSAVLSEMVKNFNARVRGQDICFDYYHENMKDASGWLKTLELRENGTELWATDVDWTPTAAKKLADKELRYFSPEFAFRWEEPESGKIFKNVLLGGGLTNRPFVKEMKAITADESNEGDYMTDLEKAIAKQKELEAANLKLSEELAAAKAEPVESEESKALKAENEKLKADLAKSSEEKQLAEKEASFTVLLTEGKAVVAQKDAYMKNDMSAFIKLAQPMNPKGFGASTDDKSKDEGDREDKVMKLAEEKCKADPKLSLGEAMKLANKEIKK